MRQKKKELGESEVAKLMIRYWLNLWLRLEELDLIRCRHVARLDQAIEKLSEVEFWFVTTTGCECLLEHQSCIPSVVGFSDAVLESHGKDLKVREICEEEAFSRGWGKKRSIEFQHIEVFQAKQFFKRRSPQIWLV